MTEKKITYQIKDQEIGLMYDETCSSRWKNYQERRREMQRNRKQLSSFCRVGAVV